MRTTGPLFLMEEFLLQDGGGISAQVAYSDGVSPTKTYLVPPDPGDDYGHPAFANSHVGFMKGIGRQGLNLYNSVEIWATPYSTNPNELQPELITPLSFKSMPEIVGGWGRLATADTAPVDGGVAVGIWTIATKSSKSYPIPTDHFTSTFLGVSQTHFWAGAAKPNTGSNAYLMRFKVE